MLVNTINVNGGSFGLRKHNENISKRSYKELKRNEHIKKNKIII
jgi:hypothetical protein